MSEDRFSKILHFLGQRFGEERARLGDMVARAIAEMQLDYQKLKTDLAARLATVKDGEPGPPGPAGRDGIDGTNGADGAQGPAGEPGPQGPPGERGEKGEKGDKGDPGAPGESGPAGEQGPAGEPGPRGERGEKGEKGDPGERGEMGPQGPAGERGERGERGDPGERGEPGASGEPGAPGERGEKGEKGDRGEPGPQGETGPRGLRGEPGPPGPKGERGERGEPGQFEPPIDWQEGEVFHKGRLVHCDGSTWVVIRDTATRPPGDDWAPVAMKGADAYAGEARGRYDPNASYRKLDRVAHDGSEWIARSDQPGPLPGEGWMLAAKAGSKGRPGERGPRGEQGPPGVGVAGGVCDGYTLKLSLDDGRSVSIDLRSAFDRYDGERG